MLILLSVFNFSYQMLATEFALKLYPHWAYKYYLYHVGIIKQECWPCFRHTMLFTPKTNIFIRKPLLFSLTHREARNNPNHIFHVKEQ